MQIGRQDRRDPLVSGYGRRPVHRRRAAELVADALLLGIRLQHPLYDCVYLALAERLQVPLITADKRFAAKAAAPGWTSRVISL